MKYKQVIRRNGPHIILVQNWKALFSKRYRTKIILIKTIPPKIILIKTISQLVSVIFIKHDLEQIFPYHIYLT